jgi:nucleoid DNA-binding protein
MIDFVKNETGCTQDAADKLVSMIFDYIKQALKKGNSVMLKDFGLFYPKKVAKKKQNGLYAEKAQIIPAHKRPKFRASPNLVEELN